MASLDRSGSHDAAIERAAALLARDPHLAKRGAEAILETAPADPRARLILASALRREGDSGSALAILRPLAEAFPRAPQTRYELGLVLESVGDAEGAIAALRQAVTLRRDLAEAWRALGDLLFRQGDERGAQEAFAEHGRASVRDPDLRPAAEALFAGRPEEAETLLRGRLVTRPDEIECLRLLGEALAAQGRPGEAESPLARLLELDPDHHGARFTLAKALFEQQKAPDALPHLERLLRLDPMEPAYRNLMAGCLALVGDFARAIAIDEGLLAQFPRQARIWLNYGHALRTVGRQEDAVRAYRRAIALAPSLGDAYWSLANLKVAPLTATEMQVIKAQLARTDLTTDDRLHLHYALGKALEDQGEAAAAMENYLAGAAVRRAMRAYDPAVLTDLRARTEALFTPAFLSARKGGGSTRPDPIFIVGLPRSGSTLLEQILASHSAVEGVMELPDIGVIAEGLTASTGGGRDDAYPGLLARLSAQDLERIGEHYIERTRIHRRAGRPYFIDKMPNNFRHLSLILLALPRAKIIDARRHPLGVCFSAFKQHFHQGQAFTYDLGDLGRYYRDYVGLMAHFDAVAQGRIHRVIYEDMVEDTEGEVRALLDACGLDYEAACLRFHENDRPVRTVSSEQVRRPIFREGLDHWRAYEPWLGPVKTALGPVLETWRG